MSAKTRIVVLHMKELIYTAIFAGLVLLLTLLFLIMFRFREPDPPSDSAVSYLPGSYSSPLTVGSEAADVTVHISRNRIESISLTPLTDSFETMVPLAAQAASDLSGQIKKSQSTDSLTCTAGTLYTAQSVRNAVRCAISRAVCPGEP